MVQLKAALALLAPAAVSAITCNADNCLRGLRASNRVAEAQAFCATFTTAVVTATSAIPSFAVAACTGNVASRVSSACSCVVSSTSAVSSSTTVASSSTTTSIVITTTSASTTVASSSTTSESSSSTTIASSSTTVASSSTTVASSSTTVASSSTTVASSSTTSASTSAPVPTGAPFCQNPVLSCHNTTAVEDLCCFEYPGGQTLLTQFWDTSPSVGPNNSWTVHGLWPDKCDGTYEQYCDPAREYTNITAILQSYGKTDLLSYMNTYWKDYQGDDEDFWEHEWNKHGTCMSTLRPTCYNGYTKQAEVVDYFDVTVDLFKTLDSYSFLAAAGILPSTTATYTSDQIEAALTAAHGYPVTIQCNTKGELDEIWYHFNTLGSIATGEFVPTSPDGTKGNCKATGIKYIPKYLPPSATTTTTRGSATSTPAPTGSPYTGRGFLQAYTSGSNKGCLISGGTWYTTGTCAGYTSTQTSNGFTLTSSKGPCAVVGTEFQCAAGLTASVFTAVDGLLAFGGSNTFYSAAVPVGAVQQKVYTASNAVSVTFKWQSI